MARRRVSNPLALAVLACLTEGPMHPYQISTTLRSRGKEHSIKLNYGSLYAVVEALQKHGLVVAQETVREGKRPERTVYAITPAGHAEFEDWLSKLLSVPTRDFTSLEAALSLMAGLPPSEVARLLLDRTTRLDIELRGEIAGIEVAREQGIPELFTIESTFRVAMLTAELDFVRTLARDIRTSAFAGTTTWHKLHELVSAGVSYEQIFAHPVEHLGEEGAFLAQPLRTPD